jgi:hypothetical protein
MHLMIIETGAYDILKLKTKIAKELSTSLTRKQFL